jgi:hypothetical protein
MEDEFTYSVVCTVCDNECEVIVYDTDELPLYCCLCGEQADVEEID